MCFASRVRAPGREGWGVTSSQELANLFQVKLIRRLACLGPEDLGNGGHGERLAVPDVRPSLLDGNHALLAALVVPDGLGVVPGRHVRKTRSSVKSRRSSVERVPRGLET